MSTHDEHYRGFPQLVGTGGIEPPTPAMSRRCSKPLSYVPKPS